MYARSFKELTVWQRAIDLAKEIYRITAMLPKEEIYGLAAQMRRAAISIPSNIAEGYARNNLPEYIQFLGIAEGSCAELETQILLTKELYTLSTERALDLVSETGKMLSAMKRALQRKRLGRVVN